MYMRWVHKPYVSKWITLSSVISDPLLKNKWTVSKGIQGTKSIKSDNEYWLDRPQQTVLSRLIPERSSDWSCDWSCNITVMNTCSLVWADERRFLSSWFDLTASSIMLTSSIHIHPSSFLASKSCRVARYLVTWPCHIEPCWPLCSIPATMRLRPCDSCEHYWNRMLIKQKNKRNHHQ